jgi:hypothetical protein
MTPNPDGVWMAQAARNMSMIFAEEKPEYQPTRIVHDRDTKYCRVFAATIGERQTALPLFAAISLRVFVLG